MRIERIWQRSPQVQKTAHPSEPAFPSRSPAVVQVSPRALPLSMGAV